MNPTANVQRIVAIVSAELDKAEDTEAFRLMHLATAKPADRNEDDSLSVAEEAVTDDDISRELGGLTQFIPE